MGLVDILIWAILLAFAVKGFVKGLIREVCSLLGLVAGGWAASKYYPYLAEALRPYIKLPNFVALGISFALIFLLLSLLFYLFGHLLTVIFKVMLLGGVNRTGGVIFGLLEGAFLLCLLLYFGTSKPVPDTLKLQLHRSRAAKPFIATGSDIVSGWDSLAVKEKGNSPKGAR